MTARSPAVAPSGAQRIAVVGCAGAGKTTLADALGATLGLPVIHLDEHYWHPGWVPTPRARWRETQLGLVAAERWIIDGSYSSTFDIRFRRADLVVVLGYSRRRCLRGVLRRWVTGHGRCIQAPGCPERVDLEFLRWVWDYDSRTRPRLQAALATDARQARVVELADPRSADCFLRSLRRANSPAPA